MSYVASRFQKIESCRGESSPLAIVTRSVLEIAINQAVNKCLGVKL